LSERFQGGGDLSDLARVISAERGGERQRYIS
jgi:hypothetical protein